MKHVQWLLLLCCWHLTARGQSDNCAGATVLTACSPAAFGNAGATSGPDDSYFPTEICAATIDNSTWYSFTAPATGAYTVSLGNAVCTGSAQLEMGIFSGTCGALVAENCTMGSAGLSASFNASAGQTYLVVIDGTAGSDCTFDLTVCEGCNAVASFVSGVSTGNYPLAVSFTNTSPGDDFYHWDFGVSTGATFDGTHASFVYDEPGTFIVTLTAFNGVCSTTFTDTILVTGSSSLQIPNVFTPNNDEENDLFTIACTGIRQLEVQIYNRWGNQVGAWNGINGSWDGYSVIAGLPVPEGVYYYRVKAEGTDGVLYDKKGLLQLFR